jgi:ATP-binding cassette, subfamily B, bacterial
MSAQTPTDLSIGRLCRWVMGYAFHRWRALGAVLTTMLLKVGLDALKPWPMLFLIDYVLQKRAMPSGLARFVDVLPGSPTTTNLIGWTVAATVVIFILSWLLGLASAYANIALGQQMIYDLASDLFAKLQQLSLRFHNSKSVGDNIRRVTADCTCVSTIVKDALLPVISAGASLIVMFSIMWTIHPMLTLLALAVLPYMGLVFRFFAGPMLEKSYAQQEVEGKIYDQAEQTFAAIPVIHAFTREEHNDQTFRATTHETLAATKSLTRTQLQFKVWMGLATACGTAAILWWGTRHALAGEISTGTILLFLSYLGSLYGPLESIMYSNSTIQGAAGSARRVLEVMDSEPEVTDKPGARIISRSSGRIKFEDVAFFYEQDRPVLRGISFEVKPGESIALVGASGAGKSTLVSLIPRFYDVCGGRVLIDGEDIRGVKVKSLREQVAIVLQDPFLFPLSIAENIAYGRPAASFAEVEAAARAANAHEFITRLAQGYDTIVGERGATLSVGQRQRISIARALLKNAPILILDEPASALDAETEALLTEALQRLMKDRTTIIIGHRLSTVRLATQILVLEKGTIADRGTHEHLMARQGYYSYFCQIQCGRQ